jgi:hypothetical protein
LNDILGNRPGSQSSDDQPLDSDVPNEASAFHQEPPISKYFQSIYDTSSSEGSVEFNQDILMQTNFDIKDQK